jgi:Outer membrane protein beta-barrel domain
MTLRRVLHLIAAAFAVALLVPASASAQRVTAGAKGGLNVANVTLNFSTPPSPVPEITSRKGFIIGGFVGQDFNRKAGLVIEVLYAQAGTTVTLSDVGVTVTQEVDADYVEVPILGRVNLGSRSMMVHIFAGPNFGFKARQKTTLTVNGVSQPLQPGDAALKSNNSGITLGAQFDFHQFLVDLRYTWGLTNINSDSSPGEPEVKTREFAVMFGIDFAKKK